MDAVNTDNLYILMFHRADWLHSDGRRKAVLQGIYSTAELAGEAAKKYKETTPHYDIDTLRVTIYEVGVDKDLGLEVNHE